MRPAGNSHSAPARAATVTPSAITEELITDAGYDPVPLGGLDKARAVEDLAWVRVAAMKDGARIFYCFAVPGER
jgi:predicted dinucleotide-binding enzyme